MPKRNNYLILFGFTVIFLTYIFFPTNNSTGDAYNYAAQIKFQEHLFLPHHLLYNWFQLQVSQLPLFNQLEVLRSTKLVNALAQSFNIFLLFRILKTLNLGNKKALLYCLIVAFSYSSLRYGTENETYILPITCSLIATFFLVKYFQKQSISSILLISFFGSLACLFHQLHFFWWFGMFIGILLFSPQKFKDFLGYLLPAFIVPITYLAILYFSEVKPISIKSLLEFVFHDYMKGPADAGLGISNFVFTPISLLRTFVQIHPNILFALKSAFLFWLPLIVCGILFIEVTRRLIKRKVIRKKNFNHLFYVTILIVLVLQFGFAFFSHGNVEFMVMIPFLLVLSVFLKYQLSNHFAALTFALLFFWNISFGIIPNHFWDFYGDQHLVEFYKKHPEDVLIYKNFDFLAEVYYETGRDMPKELISIYEIKSKTQLEMICAEKGFFYTDVINKPEILNRELLTTSSQKIDWNLLTKTKMEEFEGTYGTSYIYKITCD